MDKGWIKLHRKILDNPLIRKPSYFTLWSVLLLLANHKEQKIMWNKDILIIKEGQLLTGRDKLKELTGIPTTTIERILDYLEKIGHQIEQQKTTKFRLITIVNWKEYQNMDIKTDNKRTTNGQQTDTNKNDKNEENDKKNTNTPPDGVGLEVNNLISLFKVVNPSYEQLFCRPNQRQAIERLLPKFGREKLTQIINFLPKSNATKYAPTITTPIQLEAKMGELAAFTAKERSAQEKNKSKIAII